MCILLGAIIRLDLAYPVSNTTCSPGMPRMRELDHVETALLLFQRQIAEQQIDVALRQAVASLVRRHAPRSPHSPGCSEDGIGR